MVLTWIKFFLLVCCFTSQSTVVVIPGRSVHLEPLFFLDMLEEAANQYLVHIWDWDGIEHATPVSAVRHKSVRHATDCAMSRGGGGTLIFSYRLGSFFWFKI